VILVDVNILVYAYIDSAPQHETAREWLDLQINSSSRVGLPWASLLGFLRLTTNPRVLERPLPMTAAWEQVDAWIECETIWIPSPTERHADVLAGLLAQRGIYGNLVSDAHLAALAIEHGLTLCSADADFGRFTGLKWHNPLVPE
jgi:toxin-antitoxin system PIN domain toxin